MYHKFADEEAVKAFVSRVRSAEPFSSGRYVLHSNVPIQALEVNSAFRDIVAPVITDDLTAQVIDFVVTEGSDVLFAIFTERMGHLYEHPYFKAMPFLHMLCLSPNHDPAKQYARLDVHVLRLLTNRDVIRHKYYRLNAF